MCGGCGWAGCPPTAPRSRTRLGRVIDWHRRLSDARHASQADTDTLVLLVAAGFLLYLVRPQSVWWGWIGDDMTWSEPCVHSWARHRSSKVTESNQCPNHPSTTPHFAQPAFGAIAAS